MDEMRRGRWRAARRPAALAFVAISAGFALSACLPAKPNPPSPPPPAPPSIAVYGDSLIDESVVDLRASLTSLLPGWNIIIRSHGGAAQCDFHSQMVDDADHRNVRAAILAFSGNRFTSCAVSRPYPDAYRVDAHWAADFYVPRGIALAFVATPGQAGSTPADRIVPNVYLSVGAQRGISVVESDDLFVDPATGRYETTGPCLVGECADRIVIRAPDGGHLCPLPGSAPCAVYSSGVIRYNNGIVRMAGAMTGAGAPARLVLIPTATTKSTSSTTTSSTTTSSTTSTSPPTSTTTL